LLRLLPLLVLTLCSSPLIAQDDAASPQQTQLVRPAQPPKPSAATGSIHGFVFCGDTHKPARGALVMAQGLPSNKERSYNPGMTRTAMDGSYTIANVTEGEYGIAAFLPGYLSPLDTLSVDDIDGSNSDAVMVKRFAAAGTVNVTAHQSASHDITLTRGATVSGRVLFSDGSPASQVSISVEDINAKPHHTKAGEPDVDLSALFKTMFTHQTNGTDDEGHFRISGLATATYRVAAVSASAKAIEGDEGMASIFGGISSDPEGLHVYSGDTLHKNAAKTYELRPGDNITGIDIVIPLNAFHQVRGVLSAVDGRAINAGDIAIVDTADDTLHFTTKLAGDGGFFFPTVPSGTYKLSATEARIVERDPNSPAFPERFVPKIPVAAFADGNTTIVVKDTDLLDVAFALTEIPLPKDANPGGATTPAPPPPQ